MHQIYSCSDENIEVFTTVIPSKVSSPARRRVKSSQHLLTKNVVIESDLFPPRPLELLPHRSERRDAGDGRRLVSPRRRPPSSPTSRIPPVARFSVKAPAGVEAAATGPENRAVLGRGSRHLKKIAEEYPALPQGAEASLPLTGSASCGVPGILRKMWARHKKKSDYVGATNSAFEAD
uniref:Vexin n=1 Tax=Jaculus jaculus TaxID=51337 RepID=A0A8C5LCC3_JACJA